MAFPDDIVLAREYHRAVHSAGRSGVSGDPEAQLTTPVVNLLCRVADLFNVGRLECIPESRRDAIRPDLAFLLDGRHVGYGELKNPSLSADIEDRAGWTVNQREHLASLDSLLLCNGREARLYAQGRPVGPIAPLPYEEPEHWDPRPLVEVLRALGRMRPRCVTRVSDLARRLAQRTASLRDRILDLLEDVPPSPGDAVREARQARDAWRRFVDPKSSDRDFADGLSQVLAYGFVMATLQGEWDLDEDGHITTDEARAWLRDHHPVIAACFGPLVGLPAFFRALRGEIAAIEDLCSAIQPSAIRQSADESLGEPWLYFYEDFLAEYDPEARKKTGVYFTPVAVVSAMVRMVEHLLVHRFGRRMGFADPDVITLDPATGTGTFPLAILHAAAARACEERGVAGWAQAARVLAENLLAFEILPGPYAVAHLRVSQRLRALDPHLAQRPRIFLTDTLESPWAQTEQQGLFGDALVLAEEQRRAREVKAVQRVTVVIGNPPYHRAEREVEGRGGGGWVLDGRKVPGRKPGKSLFDDILDVAKGRTIFSHHASLYNLYVYFWRWAIWKAFEAHGPGPGVVALITASSWLHGPGFVGLRRLAREVADEGWVLDLGGDQKGAFREENIFAIETPVAIVILARDDRTRPRRPARLHYRRIQGDREAKLGALRAIGDSFDPFEGPWEDLPPGFEDRMVPPTGGTAWEAMPALADLMPWQQPGCMWNRLWPIAPSRALLEQRWAMFVSSPTEDQRKELLRRGREAGPSRETLFQTAKTGRNIFTRVLDLPPLAELRADAPHRPIVRYGFRSFDRQWAFDDPRLAKTDSPSLWQSVNPHQVFLVSPTTEVIGPGPAMTVTEAVPDKHYFRGRGGKDIFPLYRDREATDPNLAEGLRETLARVLGVPQPSPEDIAAYIYALLSCPAYQRRFEAALRTPGPRVPITREPELWREAVAVGQRLLWLHTYAQRFQDPARGRGPRLPRVEGLGWVTPVRTMPRSPKDIRYDGRLRRLHIGDGVIEGVLPEVWAFEVSGMKVVPKWLGYRTHAGIGRAATSSNPLDRIRPDTWPDEWNDEVLDLLRVLTITVQGFLAQEDLLDRICRGPLVAADEIPKTSPEQRRPPSAIRSPAQPYLFGPSGDGDT